ncbi:hypothetical protein IWZ01DRAFT_310745 [Phyllosticta capitalensis]
MVRGLLNKKGSKEWICSRRDTQQLNCRLFRTKWMKATLYPPPGARSALIAILAICLSDLEWAWPLWRVESFTSSRFWCHGRVGRNHDQWHPTWKPQTTIGWDHEPGHTKTQQNLIFAVFISARSALNSTAHSRPPRRLQATTNRAVVLIGPALVGAKPAIFEAFLEVKIRRGS